MHRVAIIYKSHTPAAVELAGRLVEWLNRRGVEAVKSQSGEPFRNGGASSLLRDTGLLVVLGGDGTMLGAVRCLVEAGLTTVPVLGVNLGGLGFLTALAPEELFPAMERVLAGEFTAPPRLMLKALVERDGLELKSFTALNDVVINKAALARIVELTTLVDGQPLTTFRADGLIIATPTGSTAYNLSAGGPICHPALDCIAISPICSFALSNRPILLGPDMSIAITLDHRALDTSLTCDGQVGLSLLPLDRITVKRAQETVRLIHSPFKEFFEILRTKLRWG